MEVKIPLELFNYLCSFFENEELFAILIESADVNLIYDATTIYNYLKQKKKALDVRRAFQEYKAASGAEREAARRRYLDQAGIMPDFRTSTEKPGDSF